MRLALNRISIGGRRRFGAFGEDFYTDPCANGGCVEAPPVEEPFYQNDPLFPTSEEPIFGDDPFYTDPCADGSCITAPPPGEEPAGGSDPSSSSDQFLSYLSSLGQGVLNAALKWGIKEGTQAASDYITCIARGGNAEACAKSIGNQVGQGAKTMAIDTLKSQIINLQNQIEKLKAALAGLAPQQTEIRRQWESALQSMQGQLLALINQVAQLEGTNSPGVGAGIGTQGADFSQTYLTPAQQQQLAQQYGLLPAPAGSGWLTKALVPMGAAGIGAVAGYSYAKKPAHALLGAGVAGLLGYLLTSVMGR
jgi:hypothetical protein